MNVTIWRHGEAGRAPTDRQRELTDKGFDDVGFGCQQFHAACHAREISHPVLILHSPWVRTAETAEIIASAFTHATRRSTAALEPGASVQDVDDMLAQLDGEPAHLLLVSHQPLVSQLVNHYLGPEALVPPLSPGAFVTLALDVPARACGRLLFWAVPPEYEVGI